MPKLILLAFVLLAPALSLAQQGDSQTLRDLLQEVRSLRQTVESTSVSAQRSQILLYRLQLQQTAVDRASERFKEAAQALSNSRDTRKQLEEQSKKVSERLSPSASAEERKQWELFLSTTKSRQEALEAEEPQLAQQESEAEQKLRAEESKLAGLQARLDQLDQELQSLSPRQKE